ncbi:MAG: hypothetical protein AAGF28_05730 [Pseudomonadota bacterium]
MTGNFVSAQGSNQCYFDRVPERLVLEGYRHWSAGFATGSIQPWEMAWAIYDEALGSDDARTAVGALSTFVRTLNRCAACPLKAFPFHSHHLCIEECLTMGLVAGIQHGHDAAELCLQHLACAARCHEVESAAQIFAKTLVSLNQRLLPIPTHIIADVISRQTPPKLH